MKLPPEVGFLDNEINHGSHLTVTHARVVDILDTHDLFGRKSLYILVIDGTAVDTQAHLVLVGQSDTVVGRVNDNTRNL